jgi:cobalt-zinc-cadmium efflux system membrane fusion protein
LDIRDETTCQDCLNARDALPDDGDSGAALSRYALKAPFSGTVIEKHLTLGEQVDGQDNLYSLCNLDTVWVIASVYQKDISRVRAGQVGRILVKAQPGRLFSGEVTWVADVIEEETRTLKIRMLVDNSARLLKPGMFARVSLAVETRQGALIVPPSAIQTQNQESIVFVAEGDGVFERREVEIGARTSTAVEVLSGVKESEMVVTTGSFALKSELEKEGFHAGHAH